MQHGKNEKPCSPVGLKLTRQFAGSDGEGRDKQRHARGSLADEVERGVEQGRTLTPMSTSAMASRGAHTNGVLMAFTRAGPRSDPSDNFVPECAGAWESPSSTRVVGTRLKTP